jgi:hypothetical protein
MGFPYNVRGERSEWKQYKGKPERVGGDGRKRFFMAEGLYVGPLSAWKLSKAEV